MAVLKIHCKDGIPPEELVNVLLAYAQSHGLGVEHNRIKDCLVLYRGTPAAAAAAMPSKVVAFPGQRRQGS